MHWARILNVFLFVYNSFFLYGAFVCMISLFVLFSMFRVPLFIGRLFLWMASVYKHYALFGSSFYRVYRFIGFLF